MQAGAINMFWCTESPAIYLFYIKGESLKMETEKAPGIYSADIGALKLLGHQLFLPVHLKQIRKMILL